MLVTHTYRLETSVAGMTAFACLIHVMPDPDVPLDAQGDEVKQHLLKIGYHTVLLVAMHALRCF